MGAVLEDLRGWFGTCGCKMSKLFSASETMKRFFKINSISNREPVLISDNQCNVLIFLGFG